MKRLIEKNVFAKIYNNRVHLFSIVLTNSEKFLPFILIIINGKSMFI